MNLSPLLPFYPVRFVYKCCISLAKLAFHLQIVHLNLQTCILLTNVAFYFSNVVSRFTIKQHYNCILADLYNIYEISKIILQKDIKCVIIKLLNAKLKRES